MTPAYRLGILHLGLLLLSLPLLMLLYVEEAEAVSGKWEFVAVALIYAIIAITGKPMGLFKGLKRFGVGRKVGCLLVMMVALFSASVAVYDLGGIGSALGVLALLSALTLFLWAVGLSLFRLRTH